MELEKIMPLFMDLSEDAKLNWDKNCNKRTRMLAQEAELLSCSNDVLRVIHAQPLAGRNIFEKIKSRFVVPYITLRNEHMPWSMYHMSFCWNDTVLDPSYGEPIKLEDYLPKAFDLKHAPATEFMVAKYFPTGLKTERFVCYNSRSELIEQVE